MSSPMNDLDPLMRHFNEVADCLRDLLYYDEYTMDFDTPQNPRGIHRFQNKPGKPDRTKFMYAFASQVDVLLSHFSRIGEYINETGSHEESGRTEVRANQETRDYEQGVRKEESGKENKEERQQTIEAGRRLCACQLPLYALLFVKARPEQDFERKHRLVREGMLGTVEILLKAGIDPALLNTLTFDNPATVRSPGGGPCSETGREREQ